LKEWNLKYVSERDGHQHDNEIAKEKITNLVHINHSLEENFNKVL
jgi:hypothetical protein